MNLMFWRKKKVKPQEVEPTMDGESEISGFDGGDGDAVRLTKEPATASFTVAGHSFAAGLTWEAFDGGDNEASAKAGSSHSYYCGRTSEAAAGTIGLGSRSAEGLVSAGVLIGALHKNALVYSKLPGTDLYWVCLISDGLPSPGFDLVLDNEADANRWYGEAFTFLDAVGFARIGNASSSTSTLEVALEEAIEHVAGAGATSKAKVAALVPFRLRAKKFNWLRFVLVLVGLLVVAALVVAGILYREQLASKEKARALLQEAMRTAAAKEAEAARKRALRNEFEAKVSTEREKFGRSNIAFSQWSACEAVRKSLPLSAYGYTPQKLECDFAEGKALVHWVPSGQAVRLADRAALPGIVDKYEPTNPAVSQFDLKGLDSGSVAVALNPSAVRMAILDWAGVRMRTLRLSPVEDVVLTPPPDIAGDDGLKPVRIGGKSEVTFQATGAMELLVAGHAIKLLDSFAVGLTKVEWREPSSNGISASVTGVLYLPN